MVFIDSLNRIYCGPPPLPTEIWWNWNFDPALMAILALAAWPLAKQPAGRWALAVLVVAFISPLCALSSALFSARVVHHVLLVAVAAPLIAARWPGSNPGSLTLPFAFSTILFWFWHAPTPYDLATSNVALYWLMQTSLLSSATWFWREVLASGRSPLEGVGFVALAFVQMGMLGAIITFAPQPLYALHAHAPLAFGQTPLVDQQLGGLLMWVPAGLPYAITAFILARRFSPGERSVIP